jgi:methionine aminotransferase
MSEFRKVHQFNCFTCDTPKQIALSQFLQKKDNYLELGKLMQKRRDYFQKLMTKTKFQPLESRGSYFQCYSYKAISKKKEKDFAIYLTQQFGVATIPVSAFYKNDTNHQVLRFCFAKKNSTLEAAAEQLSAI